MSICIPTYEMRGRGIDFLRSNLNALRKQTFKDFNVVISDHSLDGGVAELCREFSGTLDIVYVKNAVKRGNSSANLNNAMRHASGKFIKIIFQDDFLYDENSLFKVAHALESSGKQWLLSACTHTKNGTDFFRPFRPRYHDGIHLGPNTISSPSVLAVKNDNPLLFDENLIWYMDLDYYKRCGDRFGHPVILNEITVVNRAGDHQISNTLADEPLREREFAYILKKYRVPRAWSLLLSYRIKRFLRTIKRLIKNAAGL